MVQMKEFSNWDDLDFLFNRAKWKHCNYKDLDSIKSNYLSIFLDELISNNLKFYLSGTTKNYFLKNNKLSYENPEEFFDIYIDDNKKFENFLINIKRKSFLLLKVDNIYFFNIQNYIIVIKTFLDQPIKRNVDKKNLQFGNKLLKVNYLKDKKEPFLNIDKISFKKFKYFIKFNLIKFKSIIYPYISLNSFLQLQIEEMNSKSWILRKSHLDLVTNNKKNLKVEDIVSYFSNKENFKAVSDRVIETDTNNTFEEPIYANRLFWGTGNNYFFYNILFRFRQNVVPYKKSNEYISNPDDKHPLYSKSYYQELEEIDGKDLKNLLKKQSIEIKNNSIVSGKHRAFAMIGRLIENKKYYKFKVKYLK